MKNISIQNAIIRIACGFALTAFATARFGRKPMSFTGLVLAMCGGMKIGSGILRYCPITARFSNKRFRK